MGNFTYENQGTYTYLVYTFADDEVIDSMSLGMITNNAISGLANTMFMQMNMVRYMKYNISSRIPASQFFSGAVNRKRLLGVFDGIVSALLSAEEYMIDTGTILLDLDYIYTDVSTCDTVLICLPAAGTGQNAADLSMFFKNIMFSTQFDQTENCDHVTKVINYLNSAYLFSLTDFQDLIRSLKEEAMDRPKPEPISSSMESVSVRETEMHGDQQIPKAAVPQAPIGVPQPMAAPIPIVQTPIPVPEASEKETDSQQEKGMSLFYLLRHYDKENASIYKAQKEEKKKEKAAKEPKKKKEKKKKEKPKKESGFAIPGQPDSPVRPIPSASSAPPIPFASPVTPVSAAGKDKVLGYIPPQQPVIQEIPSVNIPQAAFAGNITGTGMDFGNTVFMGEEDDNQGATVMMGMGQDSEEPQIRPHLIRRRNNERIPVNKTIFRMGRNQEFNDYIVIGNDFVGNSHCHILVKGEEYFVVDDNSKNHTFVNGVMVQPGSEVRIVHGQTVTLADEEFEFRLF